MADRLVSLLNFFPLHAKVFQAGPACGVVDFHATEGMGHIHVLLAGALHLHTRGQPMQRVEEPSLAFYMNPTDHRLEPQGDGVETVCARFEFGNGMGNPLFQALPGLMLIRLADMPTLETSLSLLFKEAREQHCGRQAVLDRLMEVVIIQLLRDLMDRKRLDFGLLAGLADDRLMKAINAMHAEPARPWSLEDLADVAGMSRARFAVKFRETVGQTPGAYLGAWRLGVAQALLRRGKPVQVVADEVGYASASALSRAFTAQVGVSPREWLRDHFGQG